MKVPTSEADWQKLIGSPRGVRSLFAPTDVVSMWTLASDGGLQEVFVDLPYKEVPLKPFQAALPPNGHVSVFIGLRALDPKSGDLSYKQFGMRWRSFYLDKKTQILHFFFRPNSVFVVIPSESGSVLEPVYPFNDLAYRKAKNASLRASGFWKSPIGGSNKKNGFTGVPRSEGPNKEKYEDFGDAEYYNGALIDSSTSSLLVHRHNISSVTTPNFRSLKPGQLPNNPWHAEIVDNTFGPGCHELAFKNIDVTHNFYYGASGGFFTPPTNLDYDSNLKNRAISKAEDRAHAGISANIAQDIYQFHQLKRLVATTGKRLATSVARLDQKDFVGAIAALGLYGGSKGADTAKKVVSAVKTTAQNWLELQYAWKPLLKDISGLISILNQTISNNPPVRTVRSRSNLEKRYTLNQGPYFPGGVVIPMEIIEKRSVRIALHYSVHDELQTYVQQLGLTNGVNLAYEVLPFSFVADWFIPIGPYLESLTAWQGMTFKGGTITQFARQDVSSSFDETYDDGVTVQRKAGTFRRKSVIVKREVLTDFPRKDLPRPKNPVTLTHALNAIALVITGFKDPRHLK